MKYRERGRSRPLDESYTTAPKNHHSQQIFTRWKNGNQQKIHVKLGLTSTGINTLGQNLVSLFRDPQLVLRLAHEAETEDELTLVCCEIKIDEESTR